MLFDNRPTYSNDNRSIGLLTGKYFPETPALINTFKPQDNHLLINILFLQGPVYPPLC